MQFITALVRLALNFLKDVVLSSWHMARLILSNPHTRAGVIRMRYDELDTVGASLVGALVNLTPGTSTIAVDLQRREMLLHLLDLEQRDETVATIRRDYIDPVRVLRGGRT